MKKTKLFRRMIMCLLCAGMCMGLLPGFSAGSAYAAGPDTEMNIYAVYLDSEKKGESVILESRGEYLVMDIGVAECTDAVVRQLQKLGAEHISLYFSHLHKDHIGGSDTNMMDGLNKIVDAGITIDKMYLPDPSLAPESVAYPLKYQRLVDFMAGRGEVVYLVLDSELEVGDAYLHVVGPVHPELFHPQDYAHEEYDSDGDTDQMSYTYYENNCSLISEVVCGDTTYLATGDALKDEVAQTVELYGGRDGLKVDILKLSHHGTGSGNVGALLASSSPRFSFAQNTSYTEHNKTNGQWEVYSSYKNAMKHGMVYYVGSEKKTLIYNIADNVITMYEDEIDDEHKITGWKRVIGADGVNRTYDEYYIGADGNPLTGIHKLGSHYYHFSKGGSLVYGDYDETGRYLGWRTFNDQRRYYKLLSDGRNAMSRGLTTMADGKTYFFNKYGYFLEPTGKTFTKTIGNYTYAFDPQGALIQDTMLDMPDGSISYFAKNGRMAVREIVSYDGGKYYFGTYGTMVKNQLVELGTGQYYLKEDGTMVCDNIYTIDGVGRYFTAEGHMAHNEFVRRGAKEYYYGANGVLVTDKLVQNGGASYYIDGLGCKLTDTLMPIDNKNYYFGTDGRMAQQQLLELDGATRYFDESGAQVFGSMFDYGDNSYYADESGAVVKSRLLELLGKSYYFDDNGRMLKKQWKELDGNTCYFGKYGTQVKNKLMKADGNTYYLNENGYMAKKSQALINGKVYYFDAGGKMVKNKMVKIAGHSFYFGKTGAQVTGKKVRIDGKPYYFDTNGMLVTSRYISYGGRWYFCDKSGKMKIAKNYPDKA